MDGVSKGVSVQDRIDLEMFFNTLAGKLDKGKLEVIAAALAESVASSGADRIPGLASVSPQRLSHLRDILRRKVSEVTLA